MSGSAVGDGASCSPKSEKALITHVLTLDWKKSFSASYGWTNARRFRPYPCQPPSQNFLLAVVSEPSAKGSSRALLTQSLFALATIGLLITSAQAMAQPEANTIDFENCVLSMPGSPATARADCGFIEVPENPDDPDGTMIPIHIAIAPRQQQSPSQIQFFFLPVDQDKPPRKPGS